MDHLPKLGRRQRWLRAGRKHAVLSMWRALAALGLCAFVFGMSVGVAFAQTCEHGTNTEYSLGFYYSSGDYSNASPQWFSSANAACVAMAARMGAPGNADISVNGSLLCSVTWNSGAFGDARTVATRTVCALAPDGCAATSGVKYGGAGVSLEVVTNTSTHPSSICAGGCGYTVDPNSWDAAFQSADGNWRHYGDQSGAVGTGSSCTANPAPGTSNAQPAPDAIPAGKCPGTINGVSVLVPCSRAIQDKPPSTSETAASGPGGSSTSTGTTSSQTECAAGRCITTTTTNTTSSDGSTSTNTTTETQPQESYCEKNPGAKVCEGDESSFGGNCAGGFQCDGDAVQCAIAREQHVRNCALYATETAQSAVGYAALSAGDRPGDHPANDATAEALDFSSRIDQTDRLGGGSLADLNIPVSSLTAVTIPFSQLQTPLAMLGNLLVGISMLWALFIVFGRAK